MTSSADAITVRTARTLLRPPAAADLDAVHAVYGDSRTWTHLPPGVHDRAATTAMLERMMSGWHEHGLDDWIVQDAGSERVLGTVGTRRIEGRRLRNLGYRLAPAVWGSGLATEVAQAALDAAHEHDAGTPVTARVLTNNPASIRVLEKIGLELVHEGPRDDGLVRQVHTDRPLSPDDLAHVISLG